MIVVVNSDIIEDFEKGFITCIICSVSCITANPSGSLKLIKSKYPEIFDDYKKSIISNNMFGEVVKHSINEKLICLCYDKYFNSSPSYITFIKNKVLIKDNEDTRITALDNCINKLNINSKYTIGVLLDDIIPLNDNIDLLEYFNEKYKPIYAKYFDNVFLYRL